MRTRDENGNVVLLVDLDDPVRLFLREDQPAVVGAHHTIRRRFALPCHLPLLAGCDHTGNRRARDVLGRDRRPRACRSFTLTGASLPLARLGIDTRGVQSCQSEESHLGHAFNLNTTGGGFASHARTRRTRGAAVPPHAQATESRIPPSISPGGSSLWSRGQLTC